MLVHAFQNITARKLMVFNNKPLQGSKNTLFTNTCI